MRRLSVDLSGLQAAVERMGADQVPFDLGRARTVIPQIEVELPDGFEISVDEVDNEDGLLSYEGRQVLLYIQDHGPNIETALEDGAQGKKFHVADCRTLQEMRRKGRFERYVVTNRLDGQFYISGFDWRTKREREGWTELRVCQNCLKKLNYQGARQGKAWSIAKTFSIEEFFATYSSFFPHMPSRQAGDAESDVYTEDWAQVAGRYKAEKEFRCESCRVNLRDNRQLLHVHHKSGVKSDNSHNNLMALCAACHREQSDHGHMFVPHEQMKTINRLRNEQGVIRGAGWDEAFEFCDPGLHGILHACKATGQPAPEIGYDIENERSEVIANLEIAWPGRRAGVAISEADRAAAQKVGWRVQSMMEALDQMG